MFHCVFYNEILDVSLCVVPQKGCITRGLVFHCVFYHEILDVSLCVVPQMAVQQGAWCFTVCILSYVAVQ